MRTQEKADRHTSIAIVAVLALCASSMLFAQGRYWDGQRFTTLQPGMSIPVRLTEPIDTARADDYRVYRGAVDQDVFGDNGRLAIPRGAPVELMVRPTRDNQMTLDMESIVVDGQRYAVRADADEAVGTSGNSGLIGSIVGAITGGVIGENVRIPRNTVINFRLDRPLDIGIADRGVDRDGYHYHDWYGRGRQ
jgi:hypothetical protein